MDRRKRRRQRIYRQVIALGKLLMAQQGEELPWNSMSPGKNYGYDENGLYIFHAPPITGRDEEFYVEFDGHRVVRIIGTAMEVGNSRKAADGALKELCRLLPLEGLGISGA